MSTSQAVLQQLPCLRRYARALSGSQASGDAYVAAALESLIASPQIMDSGSSSRVALYRLFTKIWNSVPINGEMDAGAPALPPEQHLARHQLADLFLDTLPYNAHTSCSDALWAGLPVITCYGKAFPGRVAASLLKAIDLPELVTTNLAEYEIRALELAKNPALLAATKQKLLRNRRATPLYDSERFRRAIEAAYEKMLG